MMEPNVPFFEDPVQPESEIETCVPAHDNSTVENLHRGQGDHDDALGASEHFSCAADALSFDPLVSYTDPLSGLEGHLSCRQRRELERVHKKPQKQNRTFLKNAQNQNEKVSLKTSLV